MKRIKIFLQIPCLKPAIFPYHNVTAIMNDHFRRYFLSEMLRQSGSLHVKHFQFLRRSYET